MSRQAEHCFVLGKGFAEPIAREGALKIKEITYLHAEGYVRLSLSLSLLSIYTSYSSLLQPGGALKHGPFALITEGTPIILVVLDDRELHMMVTAAEEVRGRGACIFATQECVCMCITLIGGELCCACMCLSLLDLGELSLLLRTNQQPYRSAHTR
jgi:glucosamine--fructose-6-phosphate aminotransferase (isomerizing)